MIQLSAPHRFANPEDAVAMTALVNIAGEGLPYYLWSHMCAENQTPWQLGQERAKRETGAFSYKNTIVREENGQVVAALIGYALEHKVVPTNYSEIPPLFVPLQQLEDKVPGTWYVNVLATYPEHRNKGYGKTLLTLAENIAAGSGCSGLSIIVANTNAGARKLYENKGYRELEQLPMVKESWQHPGSTWVLLFKDL